MLILASTGSASKASDCLNKLPPGSEWSFARQTFQINDSKAKIQALKNSCNELDPQSAHGQYTQPKTSFARQVVLKVADTYHHFTAGLNAFTRLGELGVEKEFKTALEKIKKNPNRIERLKSVHDLVNKYQGQYDQEKNLTFSRTASGVLNRAQLTGKGGICNDFAHLLYWSLMEVARPAGATGKLGSLDENSFSVSYEVGYGRTEDNSINGSHKWVRVNLPFVSNGVVKFERVDMDTTFYQDFSLLSPRMLGKPAPVLEDMFQKCRQIVDCLVDQGKSEQEVLKAPRELVPSVQ